MIERKVVGGEGGWVTVVVEIVCATARPANAAACRGAAGTGAAAGAG